MKKVFSLLILLLSFTVLFAQEKRVTGHVTDENSEDIPGVNVIVKGTTIGTITGSDGNFNITVPSGKSLLIFSFMGFENQEVDVSQMSKVNLKLKQSTYSLDEVVAIGYGTQKKVNLTGSVESISSDQITRQPVALASQALIGLAPGLTAIQSSGQPGADGASLTIRGLGSINASTSPLILIDGVQGDINSIDPGDIANISVLKDAASAAIYGSRASNGVILVTTKRAKKGESVINYKNNFGWQQPTNLPKYLGALDYLKYSGEGTQAQIDAYAANMITSPDKYPDTDWVGLLFAEKGFQQNHSLSFRQGTEKMGVMASIGYTSQDGNIFNYGFERYNGRVNTDMKLSEKFDINFDINFDKSVRDTPFSRGLNDVLSAYRILPIYSAIHSDGSWGDGFAGGNPVASVHDGGTYKAETNNFKSTFKLNFTPVKELKFTVMYSPTYYDYFGKGFQNLYETIIDWDLKTKRISYPNRNSLEQSNNRAFTNFLNGLANYTKTFGEHYISALAGYEITTYKFESWSASRTDFLLPHLQVLDAGSDMNDTNSGSATQWGLLSYFGRLNYSFKDKYLFEASIRNDASSRFAPENRVGVFPSFSAGWRLSEEQFIKNIDAISELKLRASWGQLGNQQISNSNFPYASLMSLGGDVRSFIFNGVMTGGAAQEVMANPNIMWETTETSNIGLDMGMFNQRLGLSAEYYIRKTMDAILLIPIPVVAGFTAPNQNAATMENKGWNVTLDWRDKIGDFRYGTRFTYYDNKNEIIDLGGRGEIIGSNDITRIGSPLRMIYGLETVGIFQDAASIAASPTQFGTLKPGNLQFKDQLTTDTDADGIPDAADGKINGNDRVIIGNPFPRMEYTIDLNAGYKGFDLFVSLQGVGKRDILLQQDAIWPLFNAGKIQEWHVKEFWSPENTGAKFPILAPTSYGGNDIQPSSTMVFDGSYLRVRNVTVSYTIPKNLLKKFFVSNIRMYGTGQNLFTFDNLPEGTDPLIPNGSIGAIYPILKSYSFGIDLTF